MEILACNLAGKPRRATLRGREHLVVPVSMIVPGVLNGSQGPLYYPSEEINRNVQAWNGMPIVVYHPPAKNGSYESARTPEVLSKQQIGTLFNAAANGKLIAEAWCDVEDTRRVDNWVLSQLEAGKPIELSTGIYTENKPAENGAEHNGTPYTHVARNYRPDHLAILPDQVGACSITDGCGVNVNADERRTLLQKIGELLGLKSEGRTGTQNNSNDNPRRSIMTDARRKELIANLIKGCWDEEDRDVLTAMTDKRLLALNTDCEEDKTQEAILNAVKAGVSVEGVPNLVFNAEKGLFEKKDKDEDDEDDKKKKLAENADKPKTADEWLAEAPAEIQETLNHARQITEREKRDLAEKLTANVKDKDARAKQITRLMDRSVTDLRADADLLPPPAKDTRLPDYSGAAAPTGNVADPGHPDFGLPGEYLPQPKTS